MGVDTRSTDYKSLGSVAVQYNDTTCPRIIVFIKNETGFVRQLPHLMGSAMRYSLVKPCSCEHPVCICLLLKFLSFLNG